MVQVVVLDIVLLMVVAEVVYCQDPYLCYYINLDILFDYNIKREKKCKH